MENKINLENYKQIKRIGFGGYSTVYLTKDLRNEQLCAAKVLNFQLNKPQNDENTKIFTREVNLLSSLQHIAILHFIGFSPHDFYGDPYPTILTEYSSNGSLRDILILLNQGVHPEKWNNTSKYIILYGIAAGMDFIHQNNIIHRDLKPENILLDDFFFPKICDFGLSKIFDINNRSQQSISTTTYNYMAPEMMKDEHQYNELVDVYSYGILLFEIITEKNAYYELDNKYSIPFRVKEGYRPQYPPNFTINSKMKNLIEKCWSQTVSERPNFDSITKILRNDEMATIMSVNLDDFHFYLELIEKTAKSFKPNFHNFLKEEVETFISNSKSTSLSVHKFEGNIYPPLKLGRLNSSCRKQIKKAEEGDADMMFIVGQSLIDGTNGFQKDVSIGLKYLEQAIERNNEEATELYSRLLFEGKIIQKDVQLSLKLIEKPFLNGSSNAKLIRSQIELSKEQPNLSFVKKILLEAIDDNNTEAMIQYGKLMMKENRQKGFERDFNESLKYFKLAAENGDAEGMAFYSYFLRYGFGVVDFNYEESAKYAKLSCDLGNMTGTAFYSELLSNGYGVKKDVESAVYYAKLSCDNENSFGMNTYGCMLLDGFGNLKRNKNLAFEYLKKSAYEGNFEGLCNYAIYLDNYSPQNEEEMVRLYKLSCEEGCPFAARYFGFLFFDGKGVELNPSLGNEYLKIAADLGDSYAMLEYSRNLWNGNGIEINKEEALKYLKNGISHENKECMASYGKLILDSMVPGVDPSEGWKYLDMSHSP